MRLVSFGAVDLPEANASDDMPVQFRSAFIPLPYGGYDQDGAYAVTDAVNVRRRVMVVSAIDASVDALLQEFGKGRLILTALMRDNIEYRQTFAKGFHIGRPARAEDYSCIEPLQLEWLQDYPYWMATDDEPIYLDNGYDLDDGWVLDGNYTTFTCTTDNTAQTVANTGNVRFSRGTLIIQPGVAATMENPRLTNTETGLYIEWTGTLVEDDTLIIDFLTKTAWLNYEDDYGNIVIESTQMDWMVFEIGDNDFELTCDSIANTVLAYLQWSRHYL